MKKSSDTDSKTTPQKLPDTDVTSQRSKKATKAKVKVKTKTKAKAATTKTEKRAFPVVDPAFITAHHRDYIRASDIYEHINRFNLVSIAPSHYVFRDIDRKFLTRILHRQNIILLGGTGSGKTTLLRYFHSFFNQGHMAPQHQALWDNNDILAREYHFTLRKRPPVAAVYLSNLPLVPKSAFLHIIDAISSQLDIDKLFKKQHVKNWSSLVSLVPYKSNPQSITLTSASILERLLNAAQHFQQDVYLFIDNFNQDNSSKNNKISMFQFFERIIDSQSGDPPLGRQPTHLFLVFAEIHKKWHSIFDDLPSDIYKGINRRCQTLTLPYFSKEESLELFTLRTRYNTHGNLAEIPPLFTPDAITEIYSAADSVGKILTLSRICLGKLDDIIQKYLYPQSRTDLTISPRPRRRKKPTEIEEYARKVLKPFYLPSDNKNKNKNDETEDVEAEAEDEICFILTSVHHLVERIVAFELQQQAQIQDFNMLSEYCNIASALERMIIYSLYERDYSKKPPFRTLEEITHYLTGKRPVHPYTPLPLVQEGKKTKTRSRSRSRKRSQAKSNSDTDRDTDTETDADSLPPDATVTHIQRFIAPLNTSLTSVYRAIQRLGENGILSIKGKKRKLQYRLSPQMRRLLTSNCRTPYDVLEFLNLLNFVKEEKILQRNEFEHDTATVNVKASSSTASKATAKKDASKKKKKNTR